MTKTTHALSNGQELWLCTFTGEVVEHHKTSTLQISQQAATVLGPSTVIPAAIESKTDSGHEIWLRTPEGRERAVQMSDIGLAVRPGHTVTVLWGNTAADDDGHYFAARNHTTGETRSDVLALGGELRSWQLKVGAGWSLVIWTVVTAVLAAGIGFGLAGGRIDNRLAMALGGAFAGAFLGLVAWTLVGSKLGPERRARTLTSEIDALATRRLSQAA